MTEATRTHCVDELHGPHRSPNTCPPRRIEVPRPALQHPDASNPQRCELAAQPDVRLSSSQQHSPRPLIHTLQINGSLVAAVEVSNQFNGYWLAVPAEGVRISPGVVALRRRGPNAFPRDR